MLRDVDPSPVSGDLDEPEDNGGGPAGSRSPVGDSFGVPAVCAGAAGALDAGSGAAAGGLPAKVRRSGRNVGSTDIQ
jgi:hypothetical protein